MHADFVLSPSAGAELMEIMEIAFGRDNIAAVLMASDEEMAIASRA